MSPLLKLVLALVIGYLLGSLPTSYLAGRMLRGIDLRQVGSGNLGATNVFRTLGWTAAVPVLLIDIGKGALAVWIGLLPVFAFASIPDAGGLLAAVGAILGHSFSPFVGFAGGKSVATAAGAFLTLAPWSMLPAFSVWIILLVTTRIMSVASVAGAVTLPVVLIANELREGDREINWATLAAALVVGVFVVLRHRANMQRLRGGTEKVLW